MSRILRFTAKTIIAALCVAVFVSSGVIIHADNDDEYIQFNDYETAQAYRFWSLYGLTPDTSSTYTQTYVTNGTTTESAQISIVGTNHEGGSMSTTITEVMNKVVDAGDNIYDYDIAEVFNEIELEIAGQNDDKRDQMSLHFGACTALGTTPGGGGNYSEYSITCDGSTDNYYYNNTTFEIQAGKSDSSAWIHIFPQTTSYNDSLTGAHHSAVYEGFETEGNHISSISLTETVNESGTISSTGTITTTTTTTNTNSLKYVYPLMKGSSFDNNYYDNKRFYNQPDNPFVVVVATLTTVNFTPVRSYVYEDNSYIDVGDIAYEFREIRGGYRIQKFEIYSNNLPNKAILYTDYSFSRISTGFIPLYVGYKNSMSDGLYRYIFGSDRLIEAINNNGSQTRDLIDNGTPESQAANTDLLSQSGEFGEVSDELFTFEDGQIDDMNEALNNARTPSDKDLLRSTKFIASANWVTTQFMRLVTNTPLELVLYFCLTMGLAIVFIKKVE